MTKVETVARVHTGNSPVNKKAKKLALLNECKGQTISK